MIAFPHLENNEQPFHNPVREGLPTIRELLAIRALPDPAVDQAAPSDHIDDTLL